MVDEITRRKQNWVEFADPKSGVSRLLVVSYGEGMPPRPMLWWELLREQKPDAAAVFVSEQAMCGVVCDALQYCDAIFEKPPGRTVDEVKAIIDSSKHYGRIAMVAFNRRFSPVYRKLLESVGDKPVQHISYEMLRVKRREDHFEDTAIHAVDAVKFLAGADNTSVKLDYAERPECGDKVANYFLYGTFANGVTADIKIIVSTGVQREGCEVFSEDSVYSAQLPIYPDVRDNIAVSECRGGKRIREFYYRDFELDCESSYFNGFYDEHMRFYDALRDRNSSQSPPESCVQSVILREAIGRRLGYIDFTQT